MVLLIEESPLFNVSKRDSQMLLQFTCLFMPAHLNQIEIYFAIVQRKALTPNYFPNLRAVKKRLVGFSDTISRSGPSLSLEIHSERPERETQACQRQSD